MAHLTLYNNHSQMTGGTVITLDDFVNKVRSGVWKEKVLQARELRKNDIETYQKKFKIALPCVVFGKFSRREDKGLIEHAGFICIDFDPKDNPDFLEREKFLDIKAKLGNDRYSRHVIESLSGLGLCVIVKINGQKHKESFAGLRNYYYNEFGLILDSSGGYISKPRCITYDESPFTNTNSELFKDYPKVEKIKVKPVVYSTDDLEHIMSQLQAKNIDLTEAAGTQNSYERWVNIGFALAHKYGEGGRGYFHTVSANSPKYNEKECDRQYTSILRHKSTGRDVTMGTFFAYCKEEGIEISTPKTQEIKTAAIQGKKSKRTQESVLDLLTAMNIIEESEVSMAQDLIQQVYALNISQLSDDNSLIARLEHFIRSNYKIRRNEITDYYEIFSGDSYRPMRKEDYNQIYINAKKIVDEDVKKDYVESIIENNDTALHNPIKSFIAKHEHLKPKGYIEQVIDCLHHSEQNRVVKGKEMSYKEYMRYFFTKWYIGVMKSLGKDHNPMFLVFAGPINIGKTRFFRNLLPTELEDFFAQSDFSSKNQKDDKILMTKKLVIYSDEMDGVNGDSQEAQRRFKAITEYDKITEREVYAHKATDMKRLASLCGSTNEMHLLKDESGNRRILPFNLKSIDLEKYEKIDKTMLFMEVYELSKTMQKWYMTPEDVALLSEFTTDFKAPNKAADLLEYYFRLPKDSVDGTKEPRLFLSSTMIQAYLEKASGMRLTSTSIGSTLLKMGFTCTTKKIKQDTGNLGDFKPLQNYYQVVECFKGLNQILPPNSYRDENGEKVAYTSEDFNNGG